MNRALFFRSYRVYAMFKKHDTAPSDWFSDTTNLLGIIILVFFEMSTNFLELSISNFSSNKIR